MSELNEQLRAAFEALIAKDEVDHVQRRMLVRDDQGYYLDDFTAGAWWAWQRALPAPQAAPSELHDDIMRIKCDVSNCTFTGATADMSYKQGHRDARHAAAELAAAAPAVAITQAATREPVACAKCSGTGVVDDGEIDCYPNGEPYLCGPVKCVKDCAHCSGTGRAPAAAPVAHLSGTTPNTEAPSDERAAFEAAHQHMNLARQPEDAAVDYVSGYTQIEWEKWRAALSAQQAGVQEAPK